MKKAIDVNGNIVEVEDSVIVRTKDDGKGGCIHYLLADEEMKEYERKNAEWEQEKPNRMWAEIRKNRNRLLQESDWTQMADIPLKTREKYANYRTALRDIPQNFSNPEDVKFPDLP